MFNENRLHKYTIIGDKQLRKRNLTTLNSAAHIKQTWCVTCVAGKNDKIMSSMQNIHWRIGIHINKARKGNLLYYCHLLLLFISSSFSFPFFCRYKLVLLLFFSFLFFIIFFVFRYKLVLVN